MKKIGLYLLLVAIVFASCKNSHNVLTSAERAAGWELLFDGKTLDGWRDYGSPGVTAPWVVENGTLAALGKGADEHGYIVSEKQYENFELLFDWKISPGGNSGVFYHVVELPHFTVPYATGPEYQVIDCAGFPEPVGWTFEEWMKVGADYAMHIADPAKTKPKKVGEWNTSRILFDNGHVQHWLNGEKIVEFYAWTDDWFDRKNSGKWDHFPEYGLARRGYFSLQDHGDRAWYRNMKVRELPRKTGQVEELFNGKDLHGWEIYGATEQWYVKDGLLICESEEDLGYGYLATRKYYDDFELTADFKQDADGNSGIFFRSYITDGTRVTGWQAEVAPPNQHTGGIYESYGRGWLARPSAENESVLKMGEWNTMRIVVKGGKVTTWLNDVQMIDIEDEKIANAQGRIALQIHDGGNIKVSWKNIRLTHL